MQAFIFMYNPGTVQVTLTYALIFHAAMQGVQDISFIQTPCGSKQQILWPVAGDTMDHNIR